MPKTFQVLLKWRNFVKSGHSVTVNKLFTRQSKFVRLSLTGNHFEMTKFHSRNLSTCSSSEHSLFIDRNLNCSLHHRHLNKQTVHWFGLPTFVDTSSYVASHHETSFGAECWASVLICHRLRAIACIAAGLHTMANERSIFLDVCGLQTVFKQHSHQGRLCLVKWLFVYWKKKYFFSK